MSLSRRRRNGGLGCCMGYHLLVCLGCGCRCFGRLVLLALDKGHTFRGRHRNGAQSGALTADDHIVGRRRDFFHIVRGRGYYGLHVLRLSARVM